MIKQYTGVDLLKFVCAFLIIVLHTSPFATCSNLLNFGMRHVVTIVGVPCFFVISGFLFCEKNKSMHKAEQKVYLRNYLLRLFIIYVIWSIIYFGFVLYGWLTEGFSAHNVLEYIKDFFVEGSYATIWFLPALYTAVMLFSALHKKLSNEAVFIVGLIVYVFTLLGTSYYGVTIRVPFLNSAYQLYYSYFDTMKNGVFFGFVYVSLGAILSGCKDKIHISKVTNIVLIGVCWFALCMEQVLRELIGNSKSSDTMIMLIPLCFLLCNFAINLELKESFIYLKLRKYSMCMFLCQRMPLSVISCWFSETAIATNSMVHFIVVFISTMLISCLLIKGAKKIRILQYVY